jgi:hypothetical protein
MTVRPFLREQTACGTMCMVWACLNELAQTVFGVFAQVGLEGEQAQHALRMLRSLVRGFVINEMALSFLDSLDYQRSYELAIEVFIQGLSAFRPL